jgi:1,4-dihydroxy-2-naphthoate octaprenyltransferase
MLIIGTLALLGSYFYSAPPLSLMGSGWGELSTSIIVALLVPLTGFVIQAGRLEPILFEVCTPLILIHIAMMLTFEFPDYEADRISGKRTLAVRFGREAVARLHNALLSGAVVLALIILVLHGSWSTPRFLWLALPLLAWQVISLHWRIERGWTHLALLALGGVALFGLTAALWLIGFALS